MKPEIIERLKTLAEQVIKRNYPDFNALDYSGGNYDDAWQNGFEDGERQAARDLLDDLGIQYVIPKEESR